MAPPSNNRLLHLPSGSSLHLGSDSGISSRFVFPVQLAGMNTDAREVVRPSNRRSLQAFACTAFARTALACTTFARTAFACTVAVLMAGTLVPATAAARYRPLHLEELLFDSELIASGEITEVNGDTYNFRLHEVIAAPDGDLLAAGAIIEIDRFRDWTCAGRWTSYAPGQQLLVFASRTDEGTWKARGSGAEGEMPIADGQVWFPSVLSDITGTRARPDALAPRPVATVDGADWYGRGFPEGETLAAIGALRSCLRVRIDGFTHGIRRMRRTCTARELRTATASPTGSAIHQTLRAMRRKEGGSVGDIAIAKATSRAPAATEATLHRAAATLFVAERLLSLRRFRCVPWATRILLFGRVARRARRGMT